MLYGNNWGKKNLYNVEGKISKYKPNVIKQNYKKYQLPLP